MRGQARPSPCFGVSYAANPMPVRVHLHFHRGTRPSRPWFGMVIARAPAGPHHRSPAAAQTGRGPAPWRHSPSPRLTVGPSGGPHPCLVTSPGGGQPGGPGKGAVTGSRDPGHVNASGVQAGQARVRQCVTIPRPKSTPAQVPNSDPTHTPILPVSAPHMGRARAPAAGGGKARHRPACHERPRGSPGGPPPACS
jgi:hypothetical protein